MRALIALLAVASCFAQGPSSIPAATGGGTPGAPGVFGPLTATHTVSYTVNPAAYPTGDCSATVPMNGSSLALTIPLPGTCNAFDVINLSTSALSYTMSGGALANGSASPTFTLPGTATPSAAGYSGHRWQATPDGLGWAVWSSTGPTGATGSTGPAGPTNRVIPFYITNGGGALTTGIQTAVFMAPALCTITAYDIAATPTPTGTTTIKVLKVAHGSANPAIGNSINTSGVSITNGVANTDVVTSLTDFTTTAIAQYDFISFDLTAVDSTVSALTFNLVCQ